MFKRIMGLSLAVIMSFSLLAGCGSKEEEKSTMDQKEKETSEVDTKKELKEEVKEEPIVIDWLAYDPYAQPREDAELVKEVEERFNVDMNVWYIPKDKFDETFSIKLAAGEMPDVFKTKGSALPKYAKQGVLGEVPVENIKEKMPATVELYKNYSSDDFVWTTAKYDGVNYGVPIISGTGQYPSVVVWRQDWLEAVGYDKPPVTLDEFEEVLYKFRYEDPDGNGEMDTYGMSNYALHIIFGAYGANGFSGKKYFGSARALNDEGLPILAVTQPETKDALAKLAEWYEKGLIDPEFITGENTTGYWALSQAFLNGRIGLTGRTNYYHWLEDSDNQKTFYANYPDGQLAFGTPPVGPNGDSSSVQDGVIKGRMFAFTSKCVEDQAKVDKILEIWDAIVGDEELYKLFQYGYEGIDYEFNETGDLVEFDTSVKTKEKGIGVFWLNNPDFDKKLTPSDTAFAESITNHNGYVQPVVPPTEEYSKYKADIRRMGQEAFFGIITGEKPVDYYDEFLQIYMENGGQETQDAMQEAFKKNQ